jgi:hypothetical protein
MHQAGGRITITMGGVRYSPRGKAIIDPAGLEHQVVANHDGTVSRSTTTKPTTAELTFDRGTASNGTSRPKWDAAFMLEFYDVTIRENDVGVLHTFTNASLIGSPKIDTETGEVTGLSIACSPENYNQTNA